MMLELVSVPVITAIVYAAMQLYKYIVRGSEKWIRLTPVFAEVLGVALGIIAYFAVKSIMPADNVFTAVLIGAASGLAATGTNQIFKQIGKSATEFKEKTKQKDENEDEDKTE